MFKFEIPKIFKQKEKSLPKREGVKDKQLLQILGDLEQSPDLFKFIVEKLAEQSGKTTTEIKHWFENAKESKDALGLAKKIDSMLGEGTFRKLSFVSGSVDAQKNVLKILRKDLKAASFEGQAEKGAYLNIKENYGVDWNLTKVSRDIFQNFFDSNGGTLDGIDIVFDNKEGDNPEATVSISGKQNYDWRELVHLGGSSKTDSKTTAGGFGEGTKIMSLVLLRDFQAEIVKFASGDWEVEFYLDEVPAGSYHRKEDRGLFAKLKKVKPKDGNSFTVSFKGDAAQKAHHIPEAQKLFYSSQNPDFKNPSFENKETGGFTVLPREEDYNAWGSSSKGKGNLYIAGQAINYDSRDKWNNLALVNLWTWKKISVKDRDRGMVTYGEVKEHVIPLIIERMSTEEAKKVVRDFEQWYDEIGFLTEPANTLLEAIVNKLEKENVKMEFKPEFFAWDFSLSNMWIGNLLVSEGNKKAPGFMKKIGMTSGVELFKKKQEHNRIPETAQERKKISTLQEATKFMGFSEEDQKDVWIFSAAEEKNIIHGQYMPDFFWLAQEVFKGKFFDALHTYIHEAAHKAGPHGQAQFEYTLQDYIKKIQLFMHDHKAEYERLEQEWNTV
ncbi:MAG: hypothetical protein KBD17_02250 [Candidatus Pacebacteria bacterium]|nr:hypothetical protein [Candidatus Paceibacterota bacterium]